MVEQSRGAQGTAIGALRGFALGSGYVMASAVATRLATRAIWEHRSQRGDLKTHGSGESLSVQTRCAIAAAAGAAIVGIAAVATRQPLRAMPGTLLYPALANAGAVYAAHAPWIGHSNRITASAKI